MNKLGFHIALVISGMCFLYSCGQEKSKSPSSDILVNNSKAKIEFLNDLHNFGKLEAGEQIGFSFKFKNSGTGSLVIDSIQSDCGCLEISYPKENVLPNESNYVDILFNSAGETGRVFRQIKVFSNGQEEPNVLTIIAEVNNPFFN